MSPSSENRFRVPGEWAPTAKVWLSWPHEPHLWPGQPRRVVEETFVRLATAIAEFSPVGICLTPAERERVQDWLPEADCLTVALDDVWCRDHGPTFIQDGETGEVAAVDWTYNGWGGKFPFDKDARVAGAIARHEKVPSRGSALVCEGGAIESDGQGTILTTESVLLNRNRNPNWSQQEVSAELRKQLGAERVLWLLGGLENDDTDGHIDMVARFLDEETVLAVEPVTETLQENWRRLEAAGYQPQALPFVGDVLPGVEGSYANFLIVNEGILVPQYGLSTDAEVLALLRRRSAKTIVGFDCRLLGAEGGGIHCLTQSRWQGEPARATSDK